MSDDTPLFQDSDQIERDYAGEQNNEAADSGIPEIVPLVPAGDNIGFQHPAAIPGALDDDDAIDLDDSDEDVRR